MHCDMSPSRPLCSPLTERILSTKWWYDPRLMSTTQEAKGVLSLRAQARQSRGRFISMFPFLLSV